MYVCMYVCNCVRLCAFCCSTVQVLADTAIWQVFGEEKASTSRCLLPLHDAAQSFFPLDFTDEQHNLPPHRQDVFVLLQRLTLHRYSARIPSRSLAQQQELRNCVLERHHIWESLPTLNLLSSTSTHCLQAFPGLEHQPGRGHRSCSTSSCCQIAFHHHPTSWCPERSSVDM